MKAAPYLFAGDRQLSVDALEMLISKGDAPAVLCVNDRPSASHREVLIGRFREAGGRRVISSSELDDGEALAELDSAGLDFALSVHFPHLIRPQLLTIPRRGWLNLHPAYLPWNRGWHTPSWSILEGTPAGVTLHRMTEAVDAGDIVARREVEVKPEDTAHSLYGRLLEEELRLLDDSWEIVRSDAWPRIRNLASEGTVHRRVEIFTNEVQEIDLDAHYSAREFLDRCAA